MKAADAYERLRSARVAHLATSRPDGSPHLVPIVFAIVGTSLVTAIDGKPKSDRRPARINNITENPRVCVLTDGYDEDWSKLWWVRVDGIAVIHESGPIFRESVKALRDRYRQYIEVPIPGPVIHIEIGQITGWSGDGILPR